MGDGLNGKYAPRPGNIPGVPCNIGGIEFVLAPLGLRLARQFETTGKDTLEQPTPESAHAYNVSVILASLHRNYPDITQDELEELLDTANEQEAVLKVFTQSGLKRVTPGEIKPGG